MAGPPYWIFPVVSAVVWVGMLISMLVYWCATGRPHYPSMEADQSIAYISDVGAETLKPLFIAGSCVTTVFLDLAFLSERWLRHRGRLARKQTTVEKVLVVLAILFAVVGTCGLILLSIFDTLRYPRLHDIFLLLFIAGYIIAAIFICAEYQRLGIHFRERRLLRTSFWVKLAFILIEVILAIAFAVTTFRGPQDAAAVLEWAIAFIFTFWVLSFVIDLAPISSGPVVEKHNGVESELQVSNNPGDLHHTDANRRMDTGDAWGTTNQPYGTGSSRSGLANNF